MRQTLRQHNVLILHDANRITQSMFNLPPLTYSVKLEKLVTFTFRCMYFFCVTYPASHSLRPLPTRHPIVLLGDLREAAIIYMCKHFQ